jgi:hypothetical protein
VVVVRVETLEDVRDEGIIGDGGADITEGVGHGFFARGSKP